MTSEIEDDLAPEVRLAADIAEIAWRNVDFERWGRNRQKIWAIFEDRVRLAATTTSSLSRFWSVRSQTQLGDASRLPAGTRSTCGPIC